MLALYSSSGGVEEEEEQENPRPGELNEGQRVPIPHGGEGMTPAICTLRPTPPPRSPQASQEVAGPHQPRDRRDPLGQRGGSGRSRGCRLRVYPKLLLLQSCLGCSLLILCPPELCRGRCPGSSADVGSPQTGGERPKPWDPLLVCAGGMESFKHSRSPKACDGPSCTPVPLSTPVTVD